MKNKILEEFAAAELHMVGDEFKGLNRKVRSFLKRHQQPCIWLEMCAEPAGRSYLGGLPLLPSNLAWPVHKRGGYPLHFLAQLDLAAMPLAAIKKASRNLQNIPVTGFLFFFADLDEDLRWASDQEAGAAAAAVLYSPIAGSSARIDPDLRPIYYDLVQTVRLEAAADTSIGRAYFQKQAVKGCLLDSFWLGADVDIEGIKKRSEETKWPGRYGNVICALQSEIRHEARMLQHRSFLKHRWKPRPKDLILHQMFGSPANIHAAGDSAMEEGNLLLLQICTDRRVDPEYAFCDEGMIQFWITPQDLATNSFGNAWATAEGY